MNEDYGWLTKIIVDVRNGIDEVLRKPMAAEYADILSDETTEKILQIVRSLAKASILLQDLDDILHKDNTPDKLQ